MTAFKNKPSLRFPEFTDAWEQRKLGDIGNTFTGLTGKTKVDFGHGEAKFITYLNIFNNAIADPEQLESVEIDPKQNEVKYGDIFFTTSSETPEEVGMSSIWLQNQANVYLNSFCFGYRPQIAIDPYFMAFNLRSESIRKKFIFLAQGISRYNISKNKVMEMEINLPCLSEQKKIGEFFFKLDNLITLHQRKLENTQNIKKSCLQKMFPKNGENLPEIRFPEFSGAWEQRKLLDIVDVLDGDRGKNYPKEKDFGDTGHTLFLNASNVTKEGFLFEDTQYISEEKSNVMGSGKLQLDDIVVTSRGSLGHLAWYNTEIKTIVPYARINSGMLILRKKSDISLAYLYQFMKSHKGQDQISFMSFGSAQPQLTKKGVENLDVSLPLKIEEQQKIGDFFNSLDNLITLHQRKLENLQNIKKGLLQQMFI